MSSDDQTTQNGNDQMAASLKEAESRQAPQHQAQKAQGRQPVPNSKVQRREGPRMYKVQDTSCNSTNRTRVHDIMIDGSIKQVEFIYPNPTVMPFAEAMKFQKEGFVVTDEDGDIVSRPSEMTVETISQFGPDKVLANYEELTKEALYSRIVILPGGENTSPANSKESMISFLKDAALKKITPVNHEAETIDDNPNMDFDRMGMAAE